MVSGCDCGPDGWTTRDGTPCRQHHCTASPHCGNHLPTTELTCPTCLHNTRNDLRTIAALAALMPTEAEHRGVNSEAAYLAGPAAHPEAWSWHKITARQGHIWHASLVEDDDDWHAYTVLGRWQLMLAEDWGNDDDQPITITRAAAYLDRILHRLAHDPGQDFPLFAKEVRICRTHHETVLHNSRIPERGAPCPACTDDHGHGPPLVKHYVDHDPTGASDWWGCPACCSRWTEADYRHRVGVRYLGHAPALTASQIRAIYRIPEGTLRRWANDGKPSVHKRGRDEQGRQLYDRAEAVAMRDHEIKDLVQ
jgi:hypothetical protein